jgi:hypothetical protein
MVHKYQIAYALKNERTNVSATGPFIFKLPV